ncbi:uncharacterized protein LOC105172723 [Sesamum indicum]|uniref:Uncharacterized protein LOC105172723 n=1 Tax=Sesamum indicum TaxID=4182 RepID=A0A6I9UEG9_SESIN|nr:uncharacterized protein LOC105172723 [Sesamum indicum]
MECLNMFSNDSLYNNMGPRISFSNDFADPQHPINLENSYREAPASSDFEFSVPSYTMISADELFCKGKMLPSRGNCVKTPTLRDQLLAGDDDCEEIGPSRLAKSTGRWRERLGLKRSHSIVPKKAGKNSDGGLERIDEMKIPEMA